MAGTTSQRRRGKPRRAPSRAAPPTAKRRPASSAAEEERDDPALRRDRIIDVAIRLAEEGGFENVRQRDVAAQAGVALGTLYKSFRSKEEILSAALQRETDMIERRLEKKPSSGETATERLGALFHTITRAMLKKPNYARAVLRSMTAGQEVATAVVAHQVQVTRMVLAAMHGPSPTEGDAPSAEELYIALLLQQIWFAALVGWSAGLTGPKQIVEQVKLSARLLLAGLHAEQQAGRSIP
jgi:AcrR family transcriptional regulator